MKEQSNNIILPDNSLFSTKRGLTFFLFHNKQVCCDYSLEAPLMHYENTPMQIYGKLHPQKLKIFR